MRILIIEDDIKIAALIRQCLEDADFEVDHAVDGEAGLKFFITSTYDAAIVDIMIPKRNGLQVLEEIRRRRLSTPVLILSAKTSADYRLKGINAGADDYLTKPFSFSELLSRIQTLIREKMGTAKRTRLFVGDLSINTTNKKVTRADKEIILQPLEFLLLEYLMRNAGQVVTSEMISKHVLNFNFDPRANVVASRISKLSQKVDQGFPKKLIRMVRGFGYVIKDTD